MTNTNFSHWLFKTNSLFCKRIFVENFDYIKSMLDNIEGETLIEIKNKYKNDFESINIDHLQGYKFSYDFIENLYLSFIDSKTEDIRKHGFNFILFVNSFREAKINALSILLREIATFSRNRTDIFYLVKED